MKETFLKKRPKVNSQVYTTTQTNPHAFRYANNFCSLGLDVIQKALAGATPKKVIVVPKRIVNVVV